MPAPDRQSQRARHGAPEGSGDFELSANWDGDAAGALPMAEAEDQAMMPQNAEARGPEGEWLSTAPWPDEEPAAIAPPQTSVDRTWLDGRLADIASKLEGTLRQQDPAPVLTRFGERLDNFEARVEAAVDRASKSEDRESLRFIEAHVREIDEHFDTMRGQIARLSAIDARVGEIWDHVQLDLPAPTAGLAGVVENAVARALAAASVLRSEANDAGGNAVSAAHLSRIEDAIGRLMERLDAIEEASMLLRAEDPHRDIDRLDAAYNDGLRALGGMPDTDWSPAERGHVLHAEDYTTPARRRLHAYADVMTSEPAIAPVPEELPTTAVALSEPAVRLESEMAPHAADETLADLKLSVLRARERAQWEAVRQRSLGEEMQAAREDLAPVVDEAGQTASEPMPLMLREESLGAGRAPLTTIPPQKRPLSQGRWYRGFFLGGAMLVFGAASFLMVERFMSDPQERAVTSGQPTEAATRVAQPGGDGKAETIALPPNADVESPGAAARAASLPATIASASLRHAAANGEPAAEFEIAARYGDGRGVAPDPAQAFIWYQRSAMHGYPPAQFRLGAYYERGIGTEKDGERAKLWYRRAAEKGHVKAMHNLAVLAANTAPTPDFAYAAQWFREAAERNLADSQFNLAMLYETGRGVAQNPAEAYKWYALALRNGDLEASRRMEFVRGRLSQGELAAAEKAVASWVPTPMFAMPGNDTSERAAP